jgi:hypothetical protein
MIPLRLCLRLAALTACALALAAASAQQRAPAEPDAYGFEPGELAVGFR